MTRRKPEEYDWNDLEFDETPLTKHFTKGRNGRSVRAIVVHHMASVGSGNGAVLDGIYRTWQTREASAHYGVDSKLVRQYVWDSDTAWAVGNWTGNTESISIEHANASGSPKWTVADETWKTGAKLAAHLHMAYGLGRPVKDKTLRRHRSYTSTACPGPYLGDTVWDQYVAKAQRVYDKLAAHPAPQQCRVNPKGAPA